MHRDKNILLIRDVYSYQKYTRTVASSLRNNKFVINLPNNLYIIEIEKERDIESFVDHSILQSP